MTCSSLVIIALSCPLDLIWALIEVIKTILGENQPLTKITKTNYLSSWFVFVSFLPADVLVLENSFKKCHLQNSIIDWLCGCMVKKWGSLDYYQSLEYNEKNESIGYEFLIHLVIMLLSLLFRLVKCQSCLFSISKIFNVITKVRYKTKQHLLILLSSSRWEIDSAFPTHFSHLPRTVLA